MDVLHGPLTGRFFSMLPAMGKGQDLVDRLERLDLCWPKNLSKPGPLVQKFCRSIPPHDGVLTEEQADLGYDDKGHGFWRLWIREEKRTVSVRAAELFAAKKAPALYNGASFEDLSKSVRKELVSACKIELVGRTIPSVRVIPVLLSDSLCFVGHRSPDLRIQGLLMQATALQMSMAPMAWTRSEEEKGGGWSVLSLATLQEFLEVEGKNLDRDVEVEEIVIQGNMMKFRAWEMGKEAKASALAMMKAQPEGMKIDRLSFLVFRDGEPSSVVLDALGVVSVGPPRSMGGLLHEQLERRLSDAKALGERVGEVMKAILKKRGG